VRIGLALVAGLLLIALAAGVTLSHAPLVLAQENSASFPHTTVARTTIPTGACQTGEVLPQGTAAIRLGLTTVLGPKVTVRVLTASRLLAQGVHGPGWEGASVTVPVRPLAQTFAPVRVCFQLSLLNGPVSMLGWHTGHAVAAIAEAKPLPGRMHIEYLRPARESWWSMASSTARRLGLGRAASGTWNALLVMALAVALIVLSSWLLKRELR
jgi:hypothetical protein